MEYRLGTCSDCGARFKVPATFKADKAKCQKCKGVVAIGPVQSDAAPTSTAPASAAPASAAPASAAPTSAAPASAAGGQPPRVPARKPAPAQAAAPSAPEASEAPEAPAKKKRSGPSMKERLLAQRQAEAQSAAPAKPTRPAKPASSSGSRPAARKSARAADSSAKESGSARSSRPSSARGARSGSSSSARSGASARRATAGAARRRGAQGATDGDDDKGPRGGRRDVKSKQKSPAPLIGVVVLALIIGFGAYKFVFQADDPVIAGEIEVAAADTAADLLADSAMEAEAAAQDILDAAAEDALEEETVAAETEDDTVPEEVAKKPAKVYDPASVDLTVLADFEPYGSTTEEDWQEMKQLMVTYVDPDAGAAGRRAGNSLEKIGKPAIPAIINRFKTMDFATDQGYRDGDVTQRLLMTICSGTNVGWRYSIEPKDVVFNKKAVKLWHKIWDRAKDDEAYWNFIAKLGDSTEGAPPPSTTPEVSDDDLDDLDALGDG